MKKLVVFLLAVICIVSLVACGNSGTGITSAPVTGNVAETSEITETSALTENAVSDSTVADVTSGTAETVATSADTTATSETAAPKATTAVTSSTTAEATANTTASSAAETTANTTAATTASTSVKTTAVTNAPSPIGDGLCELVWEDYPCYITSDNGGTYPRFAEYGNTLFCVYRSGSYINFRKSTDGGAKWSSLVKVTPSVYADKSNSQSLGMDVTNPEIIALEDGRLLVSFRCNKDLGSTYYSSIRVYESTDLGKTWHFHSTVIETVSENGGLWEPYLRMIDHDNNPQTPDRLAVYYCNDTLGLAAKSADFVSAESILPVGKTVTDVYPTFVPVASSVYQNVMVQLWNDEEQEWNSPIVASDGKSHNSRDGMMVVTELSDGTYAMTIESSLYRKGASLAPDGLDHRLIVRMLFSDNGLDWTTPVDVYVPSGNAPSGTTTSYAGAPYVVTLPDGRVAVSFHSNEKYNPDYIVNTNGMSGQRYNCTMHVIVSEKPITAKNRAGIGTSSFSEAIEPIPVAVNGYSIWCSMYVYKNEYLICASGTGVNTSATTPSSRRLTSMRAKITY